MYPNPAKNQVKSLSLYQYRRMITYLTFISSFDFYQAGKILDIVSHASENCEKNGLFVCMGEDASLVHVLLF